MPHSQDVVFPGGACWLQGLCVLSTVSLTAKGPSSPGPGADRGGCASTLLWQRGPMGSPLTSGTLPPFTGPRPPLPGTPSHSSCESAQASDSAGSRHATEREIDGPGPCTGLVLPSCNSGLTSQVCSHSVPATCRATLLLFTL